MFYHTIALTAGFLLDLLIGDPRWLYQPAVSYTHLTDRIQFYLDHRSYDQILLGAVIFSSEYGYLGQTEHAAELIKKISKRCV